MKIYQTLLLLFLLTGFTGTETQNVKSFSWLSGTWLMSKHNGSYRLEVWEQKDNHLLTGKGLKVVRKDTTLIESLELYYRDDHFWYVPTVPDQNEGLPVPFKLVDSKKYHYTFENEEHDFPQRIVYEYKPVFSKTRQSSVLGDSLFVRVENMEGEGISFSFIRL